MHLPFRPIAVASTTILVTTTLISPISSADAHHHQTWRVHPGTGTISRAVAMAEAGDTLVLRRGTYFDSVTITKELTIEGAGWSKTIIKPRAHPTGACNRDGSVQGFCVLGAVDAKGRPNLKRPVRDVSISDLRLTGFSNGVLGLNTKGLEVSGVRADHNKEYGIARFASTRSVFKDNWTSWNGEAGLYLGDSPKADSVIRRNWADHNGIGIFLRDSTQVTATDNQSWGNCVGILALNSGTEAAPGDLPAGDYRISGNRVWANNKFCPRAEGHPSFSGIGIALAGVHHVVVRNNDVNDNRSTHPADLPKGGIVLFSTLFLKGANASYNTVADNDLRNNRPADIFWDRHGKGNRVFDNDCLRAIPGDRGWC